MPYQPGLYDLYKKYQWITFGENCPICEAMRGRVYTGDVYASSQIFPGFHPGCNCTLRRVDDDTPESDFDIFPEYFIQFLNHGIEPDTSNYSFWGGSSIFSKGGWKPYNAFILDEFMRATPPGGNLWDAINNFKSGNMTDGSILIYPKWRGLFESITWRSWITIMQDPDARLKYTIDHYQGVEDNYFSELGLKPNPHIPKSANPGITHRWDQLPSRFKFMP
jgi:hypothetical protein